MEQATANFRTHRWLLQVLFCICFAGRGFLMVGFATSRRAISEYFRVGTTREYEILSGLGFIFGIPVVIVIAANGVKLRPRRLAIASTSFLFLASVLSSVGFMSTSSFWLIVLGWIAGGIANGTIFVAPIMIADRMFTQDFAVVSYGLAFASFHIGSASSYATFVTAPYSNALHSQVAEPGLIPKRYLVTETFVRGFGIVTLILFASTILVCLCFTDPTADECDETDDRTGDTATGACLRSECVANFDLKRLLQPFTEVRLIFLMAANFLATSAGAYSFLRMPRILTHLHPSMTPSTLVIVFVCAMVGGVLGCGIAIYVTWRYFRARVFSAAGALIVLLLSIGLYASYYQRTFIGASVCSALLSLSTSYVTISLLVDLLSTSNLSSDRITLASIYFGFYNAGMMLFNWLSMLFSAWGIVDAYLLLVVATVAPIPFLVLSTKWLSHSHGHMSRDGTIPSDQVNETTRLMACREQN